MRIPSRVDTRRFGLVQPWYFITFVKANDESTESEWSHSSTLGISLLNTCDVFGDVFNSDRVFDSQSMRLCFQSSLVDKNSCIGMESSKSKANMSVNKSNL